MSTAPMTQRGLKYLQAAEALKRVPGDHSVLFDLLFEMAVMEGQRADGRPPPPEVEAKFRRVWTVEMIRQGIPPEVIRILGS